MKTETYKARAFDHRGQLTGQWVAPTIAGAQAAAEVANKSSSVVIRGESTSDGSVWPDHNGRVVSVREGGRWLCT